MVDRAKMPEDWKDTPLHLKDDGGNVFSLAALKVKADTLAKVEELNESGASNAAEAEKLAAVVAQIADDYESIYVPTGRTLAEIINLPAKIFTKMTHLSGTLEQSEGPPTQAVLKVYAKLNGIRDVTGAQYKEDMAAALSDFEAVAN